DIEALQHDPAIQQEVQQFVESTKAEFFQKAKLLASEPDWAKLVAQQQAGASPAFQAKIQVVSQQLEAFVVTLAATTDKKFAEDMAALLQGREEAELSKAEKLEAIRLQMVHNTYTSFFKNMLQQRMKVFSQVLNHTLSGQGASK